jgi:hypothetical protein
MTPDMAPPGQQDRGEEAGDWPVPPLGRVGQACDVAATAVFPPAIRPVSSPGPPCWWTAK